MPERIHRALAITAGHRSSERRCGVGDVWMLATILGSFAILVGFVVAFDRIVGQDPPSVQQARGDSAPTARSTPAAGEGAATTGTPTGDVVATGHSVVTS